MKSAAQILQRSLDVRGGYLGQRMLADWPERENLSVCYGSEIAPVYRAIKIVNGGKTTVLGHCMSVVM